MREENWNLMLYHDDNAVNDEKGNEIALIFFFA